MLNLLNLVNHYHDVILKHMPEIIKIGSAVLMGAAFVGIRMYPTKEQRCLLLSLGQLCVALGESIKSLSSALNSIIPQNIIDQEAAAAAAEAAHPGLAPVAAPQAKDDEKK